jgi:glycerophosphoryl diester phosphodiesterase
MFNQPQQLISLSENGVGSAEDPVYLTAHRGVHALAPENSLPSFEEAVNNGYYSAECDIQLTKDNKWVVIHNAEVDDRFCQFGRIEDLTLEELKTFSYKWGANFWKYPDMRIATLDEYLDVFVGTNTRPQIEIKADNYDLLYTVVDAVKAKGLTEQAIVISFDLEQLKVIHELDPSIELWYLIDEITPENIAAAQAVGENVWLSPSYTANTQETIQLALDAGIGVSFWTVNTIEEAKMLYDMGVRYMETDILCN